MTFQVTLIGADQSWWDLTNGAQGVKILGDAEGLLDPEFTMFWTERIGDGDRFRGSRLTRRVLTIQVLVGTGVQGMPWRLTDRAWWKALKRNAVALLSVSLEDLSGRYLWVRLERATQTKMTFDPALTGYQKYLISLVADNPYWLGTEAVENWSFTPTGENFYGGSGGGGFGPPYYISASGGFGEAMVTNDGDVPAWPKWKVTGPCSGALLTVDGHSIAVPATLSAGQSIYIDTDPPDVYGDFLESKWDVMTGVQDFWPVPVGATVPVTATVTSPATGSAVRMTITPRYERAW